jgi:cytochrome P450
VNDMDVNLADSDLLQTCNGPPVAMFQRWRETDPVHWNPPPAGPANPDPRFKIEKGFWVLTRYDDVYAASRNPKLFSSAVGGPVIWDLEGMSLKAQQAGLMGMDPPQHVQVKSLVVSPFMPRKMDALAPEIAGVAREIVDSIAPKGTSEFVYEVASRLPVYTFCLLMGVPLDERERVFQLGNALADTDNPRDLRAIYEEMSAIAQRLTEMKRAAPDDTMLSSYANAVVDGKPLSQSKITAFFSTIAIAGHETTRNTAAHFVRLMSQYPDQKALLLSDLDRYLPGAISEVLRYSPPVMQFRRTALEDTELSGQQIQAGDKIYLAYVAANRDPAVFSDPERFDITRENADKHLSFGIGQHACLGARLASLQLFLLLKEVYTRLPDIELVGSPQYLNNIMFFALREMPVRFTAETS